MAKSNPGYTQSDLIAAVKAKYKDPANSTIYNIDGGQAGRELLSSNIYYAEVGYRLELVVEKPADGEYENVEQVSPEPEKKDISGIEEMLSWFVRGIGDGLAWVVGWALGEQVTIDMVIFNGKEPGSTQVTNFHQTSIDFFTGGKESISPLVNSMSELINHWFSIFRSIAIVGYLLMLLYMGIRIVMGSTGKQMSGYKELFTHWVVGILILFLYPYVMKYAIMANNGLVDAINIKKGEIFEKYQVDQGAATSPIKGTSDGLPTESFGEMSHSGNDYMSVMAQKATENKRLSYAIVYLIMVAQLIVVLVLYYKRLFMVGFLIVIFPIVVLTYAIDKIGDGKSQAFDTWNKEFIVNVFVQVFHAVVYVFAMGVVFTAGEAGNDWLLMIVGVTFLFEGEGIIRKIFGVQSSANTMKSLADSAVSTVAAIGLARSAVSSVTDNVVGAKSHLGEAVNAVRQRSMYASMQKKGAQIEQARKVVTPAQLALPPMDSTMSRYIPENPTEDQAKIAMAINTLNNLGRVNNPESIANALDTLDKYKDDEKFGQMIQGLNMGEKQLASLGKMRNQMMNMTLQGKSATEINQTITAEMLRTFGANANFMYAGFMLQMARNTSNNRTVNRKEVEGKLEKAYEKIDSLSSNVIYDQRMKDTILGTSVQVQARDNSMNVYANEIIKNKDKSIFELDQNDKKIAQSVAILQNRNCYTAEQLNDAAKYIEENIDLEDETHQAFLDELDFDIGEFRHSLAVDVLSKDPDSIAVNEEDQNSEIAKGKRAALIREMQGVKAHYESGKNKKSVVHRLIAGKSDRATTVSRVADRMLEQNNKVNEENKQVRTMAANLMKLNENPITTDDEKEEPIILNGMSMEEIKEAKKDANKRIFKNLAKTANTMASATAGGIVGAAVGAAFEGELDEAIKYGLGGIKFGDTVAEKANIDRKQTLKWQEQEIEVGEFKATIKTPSITNKKDFESQLAKKIEKRRAEAEKRAEKEFVDKFEEDKRRAYEAGKQDAEQASKQMNGQEVNVGYGAERAEMREPREYQAFEARKVSAEEESQIVEMEIVLEELKVQKDNMVESYMETLNGRPGNDELDRENVKVNRIYDEYLKERQNFEADKTKQKANSLRDIIDRATDQMKKVRDYHETEKKKEEYKNSSGDNPIQFN